MAKHTFKTPFHFEGKDYPDIDMDLDGLTGQDLSDVKRRWAAAGNFSPLPSTDMDFCAEVAATAAKLPVEFFQALPAREFNKVTQAVSNFLHG